MSNIAYEDFEDILGQAAAIDPRMREVFEDIRTKPENIVAMFDAGDARVPKLCYWLGRLRTHQFVGY